MSSKGPDIKVYSKYGDARQQATDAAPKPAHDSNMSPDQIADTRARLDSFESRYVGRMIPGSAPGASVDREALLKEDLGKVGASLLPNRVASQRRTAAFGGMPNGTGFSGWGAGTQTGANFAGTFIQQQRPYQPEFDSPDRLSYPVHRILANRYWRLFHKLDPIIGTAIDIYSEMPFCQFKMGGDGIEGQIKTAYESMIEETELLSVLPYFPREFLTVGEACPHTIFDESKGYWVHIALHNPDQLEVIDAPFLHMDPIMEFIPDDRLRQIVSSSDPALAEIRDSVPGELVSRIQSGQNIPLDPLNATFIARKLHPYDSRGTSIISRLWRVNMYEDGVYSASIATARRAASPIKVVKMGNERTGWIPGPQAEGKMAELLAKAELDPLAWIVTHYGVAFEAWGANERTLSISRELDAIERIKLVGLGISKSMVFGEVSYASAEKTLQVLLQRLKTMRMMFQSKWIIPKFFRGVAKINDWRRISKSESRRNYRITRSANEIRDSDYIVPTLEWENPLSPRVDADMQKAIESLERLGIKISKSTKISTVAGLDLDREQKLVQKEQDDARAQAPQQALPTPETSGARDIAVPMPPQDGQPTDSASPQVRAPMPPAGEQAGPQPSAHVPMPPDQNPSSGMREIEIPLPPAAQQATEVPGVPAPMPSKTSMWEEETHVRPLIEYLQGSPDRMIDSEFWEPYHKANFQNKGLADEESKWQAVDQWLVEQGFLDPEIDQLHTALVRAGILHDPAKEMLDALPDNANELDDKQFDAMLGSPETRKAALKKKSEESNSDAFLTGVQDPPKGLDFNSSMRTGQTRKWAQLSSHMRHHHGFGRPAPKLTAPHGRFDHNLDSMPWDSPINQESRTEWQKRLDSSRLPDVVKNRLKFLENHAQDQWNLGWEEVWPILQKRLKLRMPVDAESLRTMIVNHLGNHVDKLQGQGFHDAIADIYAEGKMYSYGPLKFDEIKRKRLGVKKTSSFYRIAITVDSVSERQVLDQIADSALHKVTNTVTDALKDKILDALTTPGSYSESAVELANRLIREQRADLETDPNLSERELKQRLHDLYDTQAYNIQRIMRTEAINAYAIATLRGYKEQGIVKVKWNSHNDEKTCNICRGLNTVEFEIEYLLGLGSYPLSTLSHPQCRCFLSPVIVFVTFDEFEKEFEKTHPTQFVPTQTVVDEAQITDIQQIIKDIKSKISEFKGVPVEYEQPVEQALKSIEDANPKYSGMMPKEVRIVPDAGAVPAFAEEVGEKMENQVTHFVDKDGIGYISGFAVRDESPSSMVVRTWAQSIWDRDGRTRAEFKTLYDQSKRRESPEDISPQTAQAVLGILEPVAVARRVRMGIYEAVGLNKKFRDMDENKARALLDRAGIQSADADRIIEWRKEYVLWDVASGGVIESDSMPAQSPFINDVAALDPEHMFIESMVAYYTEPVELTTKDPSLYRTIKTQYFDSQSFTELAPTSK